MLSQNLAVVPRCSGLALVQLLAFGFHLRRGEPQILPANIVLFVLAVFVAWGRWPLFGA